MKKRRKLYKISRGSFEEQKLREDNRFETQRALLFILPLVMVAVLIIGVFLGYKGYVANNPENHVEPSADASVEETTDDTAALMAVNSAHPLASDYVPALTQSHGAEVSPLMVDDLDAMLTAARAAGYAIQVSEGYISYKEQNERYETAIEEYRESSKSSLVKAEAHVKRSIPRAGESEQQTGLVVSLSAEVEGKFADSPEYRWLVDNCVDYGFVLRYPEQENVGGLAFSPHLYRYVGRDHAYFMRAYDMSLDEYVVYLNSQ